MGPLTVTSDSAAQTFALGERLGRLLETGDFVGLVGDLGAGKTHFVRGVAEGAKVPSAQVASPTFAIVYPYEGGRIPIFHADLYRLADYEELYATGFTELVGQGAMLVEWVDNVPEALPDERLLLTFEAPAEGPEDRRIIVAKARGARPAALLEAWLGGGG
jgi:tRNA threonylcarbamoyladenosine biosynthesis protein TsaE